MSWPDAVVNVAGIAFAAFVLWILLRGARP